MIILFAGIANFMAPFFITLIFLISLTPIKKRVWFHYTLFYICSFITVFCLAVNMVMVVIDIYQAVSSTYSSFDTLFFTLAILTSTINIAFTYFIYVKIKSISV